MTVQFTEMPATFDHLLAPVLSRTNGPPASVVLALLVRGIANDEVPIHEIRNWIKHRATEATTRSRTDGMRVQHGSDAEASTPSDSAAVTRGTPLSELVENGALWSRFCEAAKRKVLSSTSVTGDFRGSYLSTARKLYAGLLLPLPTDDKVLYIKNVNSRVALAGVAMLLLDDEEARDTAIVTQPRLAMMMGWNPVTASRSLKLLCDWNVLTATRKGAASNGRFRMRSLGKERGEPVKPYRESIEAFVDGIPDAIGDVIRSVTHPAWTYSTTLDHRHWLTLFADVAGVPVSEFRMLPAIEGPVRETLEKHHLMPATVVPYLGQILDDIADDLEYGQVLPDTGERITARDAQRRAEAKYDENAEVRKAEAIEAKRIKSDVYVVLNPLLDTHEIPQAPHTGSAHAMLERRAALKSWLASMRAEVESSKANSDFKRVGGTALEKKLVLRGYGPNYSKAAVDHIMHGTPPTI